MVQDFVERYVFCKDRHGRGWCHGQPGGQMDPDAAHLRASDAMLATQIESLFPNRYTRNMDSEIIKIAEGAR
jgi:hypothetical protein